MTSKQGVAIFLAMFLFAPQILRGQATSRLVPFTNVPTTIAAGTLAQTLTIQLFNTSTAGTALYCENQTLDVTLGPDGVTGVITFNFGAGVAPPTPCPSGPPELKPGDFVSGQSRFLDVVDGTGASVLPNPPGRIPLNAAAFALNPGPQGQQGIQGVPGPQGSPGVVQTVAAGDASISVGGTVADRLVSIAPNGVTNANVANGALTPAKITGTAATLGSNNYTGTQFSSTASGPAIWGIGPIGGQFETGTGTILLGRGLGFNRFILAANGDMFNTGNFSTGGNLRVEGGVSAGGAGEVNIDAPGVIGGRMKILANGNVGMGTTAPNTKLAVNGVVSATSLLFPDGTSQNSAPFSLGNSGSSTIVIPNQLPAATILSQNLSAGTFVAFATVHFTNNTDPATQIVVRCFLNNDGIPYRFTLPSPANEGVGFATEATETFHTIITTTGGAISLSCVLDNGTAGRVFAFERRITAVRIAP